MQNLKKRGETIGAARRFEERIAGIAKILRNVPRIETFNNILHSQYLGSIIAIDCCRDNLHTLLTEF